MAIKGINTAPILQNNRFFMMAFKVRDESKHERLFFMQMSTLIDFLTILRHSTFRASQRLATFGEEYKTKLIAENEALTRNIPAITQTEVTQPDAGYLVTSIAPKLGEDRFSLIACLHNEHVVTLEIDDSQAEFIILAIRKAIEFVKDEDALKMLATFMSFMLLYDANLSDINNLKYNEFKNEQWKQHLFYQSLAVLYCFETEKGKQILAGNIVKINGEPESPEAKGILTFIASLSPTSKSLQEKYTLCKTFTRVIPAPPGHALTKDECLRALHNFCVETTQSLDQ